MGPMQVARFLDPETKRTAVLHPPNQPNETMTVHVDRLVKAHERPAHLVTIPSDLSNWIKQAQERDVLDVPAPAAQIPQGVQPPLASEIILAPSDQIPEQEVAGSPKVTQKQRSAKEREEETWKIDHIVDLIERKDGSRQYRVRFDGFPDPNEDLWYEGGPEIARKWQAYRRV